MNWFDRILDFFHLLWFEVKQILGGTWNHIQRPLRLYVLVLMVPTVGAIIGVGVLITGTLMESNWVIFLGGIILLGSIIMFGIILIPAILFANFGRALYVRLIGGRS